MNQKLIGFDAREMWLDQASWTPYRLQHSLLDVQVKKPLSVDLQVWPSVYDLELERPDWIGNLWLWDNLERLRQFTDRRLSLPYWIIAVAVILDDMPPADQPLWATGPPRIPLISPGNVDEKWQFLGFDVADKWLTSGLTNCQYTSAQRSEYVGRYANTLTEYHLFRELNHANQFKNDTNSRVPEHSPFAAFALYLIEQQGDANRPG